MSDEREKGPETIDAHQELVRHIEQSAGRIRALSIIMVVVASVLAFSYISQLLLALTGTTMVTVNLADPANVVAELAVLALVLAWLYVGASDLSFSWRMKGEIRAARSKEKEIESRISQ
jgi:membrane-anchored glycerophosphoryl diester phosphodiesterase (GDPDase)